jgi:hypothetical protein
MIPTHFEVQENAVPELVEAEEAERRLAVTTAVQWVNESITEELQGLVPSNQAKVDAMLRYSFLFEIESSIYIYTYICCLSSSPPKKMAVCNP